MKKMHITVNGIKFDVEVEVYEDDENISYPLPTMYNPPARSVESISNPHMNTLYKSQADKLHHSKQAASDTKVLTSPINGIILEVITAPGAIVKENEVLFILESMKMKTNISSPRAGEIESVNVKVGDTIESGHLLLNYK